VFLICSIAKLEETSCSSATQIKLLVDPVVVGNVAREHLEQVVGLAAHR